jgi:hypothetical protein
MENSLPPSDRVRPGEQWFCYWQTSAALWESRIQELPAHEAVFIPLFWGFHAEGQEDWDFGRLHPERDLLRLTQLLTQYNRKFCWLLPLTPAPFLPNGGVPVKAALTLSVSEEGVHLACLNQGHTLNKMYSFYSPKVFQSFVEFLQRFGHFLGSQKIKAPVWGMHCKYLEGGSVRSFFEDHSSTFEQGFSRYLKKNFQQGIELKDPVEEEKLKSNFRSEAQELFRSTAETALGPFWMGHHDVVLLGAGPKETILRSLPAGKSQLEIVSELATLKSLDLWISTALLDGKEKGEIVSKVLNEHFGQEEIDQRYHYKIHGSELTEDWRSFGLVDVFLLEEGSTHAETGLLSWLKQNYDALYTLHNSLPFTTGWIDEHQHKLKFFSAKTLDRTRFGQMLKLFLMGQRVVLDKTGMAPELEKRLQVFFLENNLKLQNVNFKTNVTLCELGEGRLVTFEGDKLTKESAIGFWDNILRYFNLRHLEIKHDSDVFCFWRIRGTTPYELNYLDVRRVNLYNPTSYKKTVVFHTQGSFAFMKMIDPFKARAQSVPHGVEVELLPQGLIALDFGHFEEQV